MATVTVKFFGPLKDIVGKDDLQLDLPPPGSGETAFNRLAELYPGLLEWKGSVRLAVNLEYALLDGVLNDGDEISFIPPVSGG